MAVYAVRMEGEKTVRLMKHVQVVEMLQAMQFVQMPVLNRADKELRATTTRGQVLIVKRLK